MRLEKFETVEETLVVVPDAQLARARALRAHIKAAAPDATANMDYGVPNLRLDGPLVAYGATKKHSRSTW